MVRVVKEEPLPKHQIRCNSCGLLLEYDNDDIKITPNNMYDFPIRSYTWFITCPNCGRRVIM